MRRLTAFVTAFLAVCLADQPALAGKRVALVIGNSSYQNVAALTNPGNDAAAITEMFKKASFDVVESRRDLKYMEMRRALRDFADKARGADIAVIYFAGHGLEADGTNYVVPVDAMLERDADVDDEAIALNRILLAAEPATQLRLVILDACRDNPFAKKMKRTMSSRSLGRGLIGVEATKRLLHDELGLKVSRHHWGVYVDPELVDRTFSAADEARIRAFIQRHMPGADGPVRTSSICLYTNMPDETFVIDRHPAAPGVAFASACSGHGFKFAPVIGEILADLAVDGSTAWPIEPFRANRVVPALRELRRADR